MAIKIDDLWMALDTEATKASTGGGWLLRLLLPSSKCPLFIALELSTKRRAILLRLPAGLIPARRIWPRSKGLESVAVSMDGNDHFGVVLKEHRFNDVFNALVEDLV